MTSENNLDSWLNKESFRHIVASTPLISIDLIVRNETGQVLLGQRLNRPAQGYWFVPGGRIRKNERIDVAFRRLTLNELGLECSAQNASFSGVFEHLYEDNFSGTDFSTHYVVLAYELRLSDSDLNLPLEQHSTYKWQSIDDVIQNESVHANTRVYFDLIR